jgi:type I restriction enzyme S subunit
MSEEATLDEFVGEESKDAVDVGSLQQLEESPVSEWTLNKLGSLLTLEYGDNLPSDSREVGEIPVFGSNGQVDTHSEPAINEPGIIMGRKGSIGEIEFSEHPFWPIDTTYYLTRNETDENLRFLYYLLQNIQLERLNAASAIPGLNRNDAYGLNALVPPLPEQRQIATVLYTVDRAIENAEKIDEQLQRVKKGAAQELFTCGLNNEDTQSHHIGDFPQSWEFDKISNLAEIERGNTPRTSQDEYYGGEIVWVTPDDLSDLNEDGNGKYISDSGRKLTPEGVESSSLTVVEPDSIMFTSRSYGIGRTAICTVPAATNQGITAFECGESLDTEFFYYYLNYIMDYVVSISGGSTFPEISKTATGNIDVPVPGIEEQKEIASLLSQFDEQLLHNREVTSQLKRLKRGLMQDLLSGTVRTTDTNIEVPDEIAQYG